MWKFLSVFHIKKINPKIYLSKCTKLRICRCISHLDHTFTFGEVRVQEIIKTKYDTVFQLDLESSGHSLIIKLIFYKVLQDNFEKWMDKCPETSA